MCATVTADCVKNRTHLQQKIETVLQVQLAYKYTHINTVHTYQMACQSVYTECHSSTAGRGKQYYTTKTLAQCTHTVHIAVFHLRRCIYTLYVTTCSIE